MHNPSPGCKRTVLAGGLPSPTDSRDHRHNVMATSFFRFRCCPVPSHICTLARTRRWPRLLFWLGVFDFTLGSLQGLLLLHSRVHFNRRAGYEPAREVRSEPWRDPSATNPVSSKSLVCSHAPYLIPRFGGVTRLEKAVTSTRYDDVPKPRTATTLHQLTENNK